MDIETVWYNRLTNRKSMEVQNLKEFSDQGRIFIQWQQSSQRVLRIKPIFQIGRLEEGVSGPRSIGFSQATGTEPQLVLGFKGNGLWKSMGAAV
jgi:hypothetical protein